MTGVSYSQDSDAFTVTRKRDSFAITYRAPGHLVRERFRGECPLSGQDLANAVELIAIALGAKRL